MAFRKTQYEMIARDFATGFPDRTGDPAKSVYNFMKHCIDNLERHNDKFDKEKFIHYMMEQMTANQLSALLWAAGDRHE